MSRELDYQIATQVLGFPPFDWQISDRLATEFSHGELHHGVPCLVCGRERSLDDLACLPRYSSDYESTRLLLEIVEGHGVDTEHLLGLTPERACELLLRARGKEVGLAHG